MPQFFTGPFNAVHLRFKLIIPLFHHLQSHLRQVGLFGWGTIQLTVRQLPLLSCLFRSFCLDLVFCTSDELLLLILQLHPALSVFLLPLPFLELLNAQPETLIIQQVFAEGFTSATPTFLVPCDCLGSTAAATHCTTACQLDPPLAEL